MAIIKVQDSMEQNHSKALLIADLSKQFGFSERNLKRRFKLATGLSPTLYLQKVRLEKAKKLLLVGKPNVNDIAYAVGYHNVSFFIRLFKKHLGVTPNQWRGN
jgi:transcriptional regulator GlxA family with amidase domain